MRNSDCGLKEPLTDFINPHSAIRIRNGEGELIMRNKRLVVVLVGAVAFGLVAAVSVSRYLSSAQAYTKNLNNVVVAKVDIPAGTKVVAEQLETIQFPSNARSEERRVGKECRSRWS